MKPVTVIRREHFNAAHRLHNPDLDDATNKKIFGKCNNQYFHGHNYELIVKLYGEINEDTGMLMDLSDLKKIIKNEVEEKLDHKNLNLDIDYFKDKITSTENLAIYIWNRLNDAINIECKLTVVLYETPRNFVEFAG